MARLRKYSSPLRLLALAFLGYAALFAFWLEVRPLGEFSVVVFSNVATTIAPIAAGLLSWIAAAKAVGRLRFAWFFIGAGCFSWGLGQLAWTWYESVLLEYPFPSIADVGYLGAIPLIFLGLLLLASPSRLLVSARTSLDAAAIVLTVTALLWYFVLRPIYQASDVTLLEKALSGAYPEGDLVLFVALILAASRQWAGRAGAVLGTFAVGLGLFLASDVGFAYLTITGKYSSGSIVDYGWAYGFLAMGYAAALQASWRTDVRVQERSTRAVPAWRQAVPFGLLLLLLCVMVATALSGSAASDPVFLTIVALVTIVIGLRQGIVLWDNVQLNRELLEAGQELETRVQERTHQLEQASQDQLKAEEEQRRLASVLEATPDFVATFDLAGRLLFINRAARLALGLAPDADMRSTNLIDQFPPWASELLTRIAIPSALRQGVWKGETAIKDGHGGEIPVSQVIVEHRLADGSPPFLSTVARDIRERKQFEAQLVSLASQDSLTKLTNRRRFEEELTNELARVKRFKSQSAPIPRL